MHFVAIDVETANYSIHSICQIGIVEYKQGVISTLWSSLINPLSHFNPFNVNIHGITKNMVATSPTFTDIYPELLNRQNRGFTHLFWQKSHWGGGYAK